jgi:F-type H+-transporting ATPase subunit gamma
MPNVLDIRRRIRSVRNTRQITKAMKMVSAAKLRRAQERALAARPYSQMLENVLKSLVSRTDIHDPDTGEPRHPLLARRPEQHIQLIIVTGDKGLAGAFSTNLLKAAASFLQDHAGKTIDVLAIGRKGRDWFRRRYPAAQDGAARANAVQLSGEYVNVLGHLGYETVTEIVNGVIQRYVEGQIDGVYILYNEFKSVIAQRLIVDQILPIQQIGDRDVWQAQELSGDERQRAAEAARTAGVSVREQDTSEIDRAASQFGAANVDYIYEQSPEELFRGVLPRYVSVQIYRAMLESIAAEHAARMTAMDSATTNATKMIDSLTLVMNRARQAKITKEIIEIVSGAAAL